MNGYIALGTSRRHHMMYRNFSAATPNPYAVLSPPEMATHTPESFQNPMSVDNRSFPRFRHIGSSLGHNNSSQAPVIQSHPRSSSRPYNISHISNLPRRISELYSAYKRDNVILRHWIGSLGARCNFQFEEAPTRGYVFGTTVVETKWHIKLSEYGILADTVLMKMPMLMVPKHVIELIKRIISNREEVNVSYISF